MLQATHGSWSWCCEIVVRQLSKLEPQQKTAQLWAEDFLEWKGSRQSFSPWIISELFFLDLFKASWVQFIAVPRGLVSNLWRGSWGRIFLRRGEETDSLQNEGFFKVMKWWICGLFWNLLWSIQNHPGCHEYGSPPNLVPNSILATFNDWNYVARHIFSEGSESWQEKHKKHTVESWNFPWPTELFNFPGVECTDVVSQRLILCALRTSLLPESPCHAKEGGA